MFKHNNKQQEIKSAQAVSKMSHQSSDAAKMAIAECENALKSAVSGFKQEQIDQSMFSTYIIFSCFKMCV